MEEDRDDRNMGLTKGAAIFMIGVGLWLWMVLNACCAYPKELDHKHSTKDIPELKIVMAEVIDIDSSYRLTGYVCYVYWRDDDRMEFITLEHWPCRLNIGFRMPILKRK